MQTAFLRAALCALLLAFASLGHAQSDPAKIKLIEQEAAGWSRDMDLLLSLFPDDLVYEDVPLGLVFRSKEELRGFAGNFFKAFPDLKSVCQVIAVDGNFGFCEWRFTGTQAADLPNIPSQGKSMDLRGISIYEFEGGKIKRTKDYWDSAALLRQLGVIPAK
jgi:steroid delta-isomerase-like uncharacterized protein